MAGKEGYEPEYLGRKSANVEARQMQPLDKNMSNVVDKKMGMQPVKNVEKAKKDSDTATAQKYKTSGIDLMTLVAKTVRGVKKMDATGEKMKKVNIKENKEPKPGVNLNTLQTSDLAKRAKAIFDKEEEERKEKNTKLNKESLLQMIREELKEMFDGMEPMDRKGLDENWVTPQEVKEDYGFYSDMYKEEHGSRPDKTPEQLANWLNSTFKLDGKTIVKK